MSAYAWLALCGWAGLNFAVIALVRGSRDLPRPRRRARW